MRQIANLYTFSAAQRRVTILGVHVLESRLESIVNATKAQAIWERPTSLGTVSYSNGNTVVDLAFNTSAHADSDSLSIYYDDGRSGEEVTSLSHIDKIGGGEPADFLKKGYTARIPVDVGSTISVTGASSAAFGASRSFSSVNGILPPRSMSTASVTILPEGLNRKYLFFQNLSDRPIILNFGASASVSEGLRVDPGSSLTFEGTVIPTNPVSIAATSPDSSQAYIAYHA